MHRVLKNAKPCPMCGCREILLEEPEHEDIFTVYIRCSACGLTGYKNFLHSAKNPIEKTIQYWNTRA